MKRFALVLLALAGVFLIVPQAMAAVPGSPYYNAVTALNPANYYTLADQPYGSDPLAVTATNYGSLGVSATYIGLTPSSNAGFNLSTTASDATGFATTAFIGGNIGPFMPSGGGNTDLNNNATAVANQLPGFFPNYAYSGTASNTATGVNRVWEPNANAALNLGSNANFMGNPTTGAFTFAGWVSAGQNSTQFYDAGGNYDNGMQIFDTGGTANDAGQVQIMNTGRYGQGIIVAYGATPSKVSNGYLKVSSWYPSGNPPANNGGNQSTEDGKWEFVVLSTSGTSDAQRYANTHIWVNGTDVTNMTQYHTGGWATTNYIGQNGGVGIAKVGYLSASTAGGLGPDASPGSPHSGTASQLVGNKVGDISTWNSALNYAQIESLYVAAVTPLSGGTTNTGTPLPPVNSTTTDGNWADNSVWSAGVNPFPQGHQDYMVPYQDVQVNNNMIVGGTGPGGWGTTSNPSYRANMYNLTVNSSGSASTTMYPATTLRAYNNMAINGKLVMNGDGGLTSAASWTNASVLDAGNNVTIGSGAVINMNVAPATGGGTNGVVATPVGQTAAGANAIVANGNLTINSGAQVALNATSYLQNNTSGPQLYTVAQAASALGNGGLGATGVLAGNFTVVGGSTALNNAAPADPQGRRLFVLREGAASDGSGTVNSIKVGFAKPGDATLNGNVDINDVGAMGGSFNGPGNWRQGDYTNDGQVNVLDINALRTNYNTSYAPVVPAIHPNTAYATSDGPVVLNYNSATGDVLLVGPTGGTLDGLTIESASGALMPANWTSWSGSGDFYTGSSSLIGFNGFLSGHTVSPDLDLGDILPAGWTKSQLQADLTISYFNHGDVNDQFTGSAVPEPSTLALLAAVAGGFLMFRWRRWRGV